MATQFSTATAIPSHPAPYQHHAYRKSTQYSPTGTPLNISPTSPRETTHMLHYPRTIRPVKQAMGVPAALRKTERPAKHSPPEHDSACASPNGGWAVNGGFPSVNDGAATPVSQVNNEDMHSIYNEMPLSPIAGPITRNHWQVRSHFFSYCMSVPALASALSRAKVCWGGQLLRTGFGVDSFSAVLNLASAAAPTLRTRCQTCVSTARDCERHATFVPVTVAL